MRVGMHTENEITPKAKNNVLTRCQGENLVWGMKGESDDLGNL
jgi:hypothetical protein